MVLEWKCYGIIPQDSILPFLKKSPKPKSTLLSREIFLQKIKPSSLLPTIQELSVSRRLLIITYRTDKPIAPLPRPLRYLFLRLQQIPQNLSIPLNNRQSASKMRIIAG